MNICVYIGNNSEDCSKVMIEQETSQSLQLYVEAVQKVLEEQEHQGDRCVLYSVRTLHAHM